MAKGGSFEYKGKYYDRGTVVRLKTKYNGIITTTYEGSGEFEGVSKYAFYSSLSPEDYIVEIIKPIYYKEPEINNSKKSSIFTRTGSGSWQSSDTITLGLIWYIIIMIVGALFVDRWLIWIAATVIFFSWKAKK